MILGASGFLGNALYKELLPYFDVYGTYFTQTKFEKNKNFLSWDLEWEPVTAILEKIQPDVVVSSVRGNFNAQYSAHVEIIDYLLHNQCKLVFLSSANVFDAFTNYPSYEHDKTLSDSIYGRFKIKIENALMRLRPEKYLIARLPMIFGANSPRVQELLHLATLGEPIEVFPNVVINATYYQKFTQQVHYLLNHDKNGIFHLGSNNLVHHHDLIQDICNELKIVNPVFKLAYSSNEDRFLAVLPKDNQLPENLQVTVEAIVSNTSYKS